MGKECFLRVAVGEVVWRAVTWEDDGARVAVCVVLRPRTSISSSRERVCGLP